MELANNFQFKSLTLTVSYSSSSIDGKPQLSYKKGAISRNFRGNDLRIVETEIGTLITVTLHEIPDLKSVVFTLIVPQVNVSQLGQPVPVTTKAIETTIRTSIGGPGLVKGQVESYKSFTLKGKASSVVF